MASIELTMFSNVWARQLRRLAGFALLPALSILATLVILPLVSKRFGAAGWVAIGLGQSIGAIVSVVASLAWPIVGGNLIARASGAHERQAIFRESIYSRSAAFVLLLLVAVPLTLALSAEHSWATVLFMVGVALNGLTAGWYYAGIGQPRYLVINEGVVRLLGYGVAMVGLMLGAGLFWYSLVTVGIGLVMCLLNWYRVMGTNQLLVPAAIAITVKAIRSQLGGTASRTLQAGFLFGGSAIFSAVAPSQLALFSALDQVRKAGNNSMAFLPNAFVAWVGSAGGAQRNRRMKRSLLFIVGVCIVVAFVWISLGPLVLNLLFSGHLQLSMWGHLLLVAAIESAVLCRSVELLVLIPLGRANVVYGANSAASVLGLLMVAGGALIWGALGGLSAWVVIHVLLLLYYVIEVVRRAGTEPANNLHKQVDLQSAGQPTSDARGNTHRRPLGRRVAERVLWAASRLIPKDPGLIVIYGLPESEDGALAVQHALSARGRSVVRLTDRLTCAYWAPSVRYERKHSLRGLWFFARSGILFTSHALFGGIATVKGQRNVLLWHGEVVKPVGLLDGDRPVAAGLAPVCSEIGSSYRRAEFGLDPEQVPILGAPRNDRMLTSQPDEVRERLGWRRDASIWLWLPTYRNAVRGGRREDTNTAGNGLPFDKESLEELDRQLSSHDMTLLLKPHPLTEISIQEHKHGLQLLDQADIESSGMSLYQVLSAVDGLVTDVSSVWIDYLLLRKPIIFAFPDVQEYRQRRGFNLEPYESWIPGPLVRDINSLVTNLTDFRSGRDPYAANRVMMLQRFHRFTDADSTARLLNLLDIDASQQQPRQAEQSSMLRSPRWKRNASPVERT
jgi:hypothetical protein